MVAERLTSRTGPSRGFEGSTCRLGGIRPRLPAACLKGRAGSSRWRGPAVPHQPGDGRRQSQAPHSILRGRGRRWPGRRKRKRRVSPGQSIKYTTINKLCGHNGGRGRSRTYRGRRAPSNGFEVRAPHRGGYSSRPENSPVLAHSQSLLRLVDLLLIMFHRFSLERNSLTMGTFEPVPQL